MVLQHGAKIQKPNETWLRIRILTDYQRFEEISEKVQHIKLLMFLPI
jgi:hypothetical protein